jgi:glycogen debranching enzyme
MGMIARLIQFFFWSLGYAALDFYRTVQKVLGREVLVRPNTEGLEPIEVVRTCLESCLEVRRVSPTQSATVLCAGFRHFREPWARDFGFASYGLMAEGRPDVVRDGVMLFFRHQKSTGQLPLKLHSTVLLERYLHSLFARVQPVDANLIPRFITAHGTRSLDSALLLIIAWGECVLHTRDEELAVDLHGQVLLALEWVERSKGTWGLLHQGPFADWADSIARRGAVLYTNVLWWKAVRCLEEVEAFLPNRLKPHKDSSHDIGERVLKHFYSESLGYLKATPHSSMFTSAGNFMAVAWGLTTRKQSLSILDYADKEEMATPVPSRVTDREYPFYQVGPEMWIAGISNYHTSCSWMWIGGWHVVANHRVGRRERAREIQERMLATVARDGTVYEVHGPDGNPLATKLYHSEDPLSWNAAMILYAESVTREN